MTYMSCPYCRFVVRLRGTQMVWGCCPRCLAHRRVSVPMHTSEPRLMAMPRVAPPAATTATPGETRVEARDV